MLTETKGGQATSRPAISPPLKWHIDGGKYYLADRIVSLMPPHTHYVEAFAGGLSVLLAKDPEGVSEVANDANGWLTNFWEVLRDRQQFEQLRRFLEATPFSEAVFTEARELLETRKPMELDGVTAAAWFFVCVRQSRSGLMKSFAPLSRNRTRRGMNEQASAWLTAIEGLPAVHDRLARVVIYNSPAVKVIEKEDGPNTLFYLDPPYHPGTRTAKEAYGEHEMTAEQHDELLDVANACQGKVMISGYDCEAYRRKLAGWTVHQFDLPNNAAGGAEKRRMVETVWCNF